MSPKVVSVFLSLCGRETPCLFGCGIRIPPQIRSITKVHVRKVYLRNFLTQEFHLGMRTHEPSPLLISTNSNPPEFTHPALAPCASIPNRAQTNTPEFATPPSPASHTLTSPTFDILWGTNQLILVGLRLWACEFGWVFSSFVGHCGGECKFR